MSRQIPDLPSSSIIMVNVEDDFRQIEQHKITPLAWPRSHHNNQKQNLANWCHNPEISRALTTSFPIDHNPLKTTSMRPSNPASTHTQLHTLIHFATEIYKINKN